MWDRKITFPCFIDTAAFFLISFFFLEQVFYFFFLINQGEFLSVQNPGKSGITPPDFDTVDSSNKMVYIWLSDFTINSAGRIYHEAGFLKHLTTPNDRIVSKRYFLSQVIIGFFLHIVFWFKAQLKYRSCTYSYMPLSNCQYFN